MAVKMRLIRMGKKKTAYYRVVVMDGRSPRDGRYIEQIGTYDPHHQPSKVEIDNDRAIDWMKKGAQPTDPVRKLLEISGALSKFKVASGQIHTVGAQPPAAAPEPTVEVETPVVASDLEAQEPKADAPEAVSQDAVADESVVADDAADSEEE